MHFKGHQLLQCIHVFQLLPNLNAGVVLQASMVLVIDCFDSRHCNLNLLLFLSPQAVQQDIVHSGIQSKADKSPVTVADYGTCSSCKCISTSGWIFCLVMNRWCYWVACTRLQNLSWWPKKWETHFILHHSYACFLRSQRWDKGRL